MSTLFFKRVLALPEVLDANTFYMVRSEDSDLVDFYITGTEATEVRHIISKADVSDMVEAALASFDEEGASKLAEERTIALTGDGSASIKFDGSADASGVFTLKTTGVAAGEYQVVTVNAKGLVTAARALTEEDLPTISPAKIGEGTLDNDISGNAATAGKLQTPITINGVEFDGSKSITITAEDNVDFIPLDQMGVAGGVATLDETGLIPAAQLPSYVDEIKEYNTEEDFPEEGEKEKIYVAKDTNKIYRWSGSAYIPISDAVSVADEAIKLAEARTITATGDASYTVSFDGSKNVTGELTLTASGVEAGEHQVVTVDAKGRVTEGRDLIADDIPTLPPTKISAGTLNNVDTTGNAATATTAGHAETAAGLVLSEAEW